VNQALRPTLLQKGAQTGLSLVELMVGLTMGLIVSAALLTLYVNLSRTNAELSRTSVQIENGRFASQLLRANLQLAGFWGTYLPKFDNLAFRTAAPDDVPTDVPSPCKAYADWTDEDKRNFVGLPVAVYDAVPTGCETLITNLQPNTDILVIRHAEPCIAGESNCDAFSTNVVYFQSSLDVDCSPTGSYPAFRLEHRGTTAGNLRLKSRRNCATAIAAPVSTAVVAGDAPLRRYISNIYWVRNHSVTPGDGIPTLVRSQFAFSGSSRAQQLAQPLVDGIESLRFELGIDSLTRAGATFNPSQKLVWTDPEYQANASNRGDGVVDGAYVRCGATCTASQLMNAISVRVYLLARAREPSAGYTDTKTYLMSSDAAGPTLTPGGSFRRQVFTSTVRLVGLADRRDTP
jgi:type IV pilus assembly protein PilW